VARRWKILLAIGLLVALLDQWSKFLAVKHLTPAMQKAGVSGTGAELAAFYGAIKGPCNAVRSGECPTVQVVDGFWNWRYVENKGAAWGLFANANDSLRVPFFIVVSLGAIAFIISFFRKLPDDQMLLIISLSLVFGGAIGNFMDRLHLNYVIDFIDWYVGSKHWPTFNVADSAITSGVVLLMIQWIRDWATGKNKTADASAAPGKTS
jgi:signal peptidase II